MDIRTRSSAVAGHTVLAIEGAADLAAAPVLHDALQRLVGRAEPATVLAVDLDGTTVLDDATLGLLLGAAATARDRGCTLRIVCSDDRLRRRLADTRIDRVVDVVTTLSAPVTGDSPGVS